MNTNLTQKEREKNTKVQELREKFSLSETFFSQNEIRIKKNQKESNIQSREKPKKKKVESIIIIMCIYFTLKWRFLLIQLDM